MKAVLSIMLLGTLALAGLASASTVTNVSLSYENGATVARIEVQGPIRFTHQTEIPKDGKPDRMILDVIGATNEMAAKSFSNLPACGISGIRTSQYAVTPEKIARVVFDMLKAPIYRVESEGTNIKVIFTDNTVKQFSAWSAAKATPTTTAPKPTALPTVAQQTTTPAVSPVSPAQQAKAMEQDRQASLSGSEPKPAAPAVTAASRTAKTEPKPVAVTPATPNTVPKVEVKPPTPVTPATQSPVTSQIAKADQKPPTPATPSSTTKPEAKPGTPAVASTPVEPKPIVATPKAETKPVAPTATPTTPPTATTPSMTQTPNQAAVKQTVPTTPASPHAKKDTPAQTDASKPSTTGAPTPASPAVSKAEPKPSQTVATGTQPAVTKVEPSPIKGPAPAVSKVETPQTVTPTETKPIAPSSTPSVAKVETKGTEPLKSAVTDSAKALAAKPDSGAEKPQKPAQVAQNDEQFAPTDTTKSTARFRRSPASQAKIKGTMVAEFPQRLVVKYEAQEYRDPFAPLLDDTRTFNNPVKARLPNVEGLKLVGIIESSEGDNRALFEDKNGYSYMLQSGDKVQKGYVLRVERDRVYFQIFEYGWSRTIALTIVDESER
ncbi:MAG: hypothetical protein AB1644_00580 [Candidatus Zixiibacteriota bacterium]